MTSHVQLATVNTALTSSAKPAQAKSNAPSFDSMMALATDLGDQAGKGKDTQIKFALAVIDAAYLGTLSLDKNKHGLDKRDGKLLAEAYVKAQQGSVIFDAKSDKARKLVSNIDKCIRLGSNPKWGRGQPMQTVQELVEYRQTLRKDPATAKKLDDAFNMLMRFATAQLKSDTLLPDDERNAFAYRTATEVRTTTEVLEGIKKLAMRLTEGKVSNCDGYDNSVEVQGIVNLAKKRLADIAKGK